MIIDNLILNGQCHVDIKFSHKLPCKIGQTMEKFVLCFQENNIL